MSLLFSCSLLNGCEQPLGTGGQSSDHPGLNARPYFYYQRDGSQRFVTLDPSHIAGQYDETVSQGQRDSLNAHYGLTIRETYGVAPDPVVYWFAIAPGHRVDEFLTQYGGTPAPGFGQEPRVLYATPSFVEGLLLTDTFEAQFHSTVSEDEIERFNKQYNVVVVEREQRRPGSYLLRVTKRSPGNALDMANLYQASPLIDWVTPKFVGRINPNP